VKTAAALANAAWLARNLAAARRFARALDDPRGVQAQWLRRTVAQHAASEVGRTHDFAAIRSADEFARRVPLTDYDGAVAPVVERILRGEACVLSADRVTHLVPTSGSTGARKLIPFTAGLQRGFDEAVGAWTVDLARRRPGVTGGPAYWSISPLAEADRPAAAPDAVPIGFADDASYLGGSSAWLARQVLAVPAAIRHATDVRAFWRLTALALLRQPELRLISIWHPTFLECLVEAAADAWSELLDAVANGECPWESALPVGARGGWRTAPDPRRAAALRGVGRTNWPGWWPALQVVSCWGDQAAEPGWRRLVRMLPGVLVQAKGLLATEAVVTIPWDGHTPVAVTSHFFEFLDGQGEARGADQLQRNERYEVVVTNGGGLWRYRLGDIVECTGHVGETPSLRFLGRAGRVSDLRGEKLSEVFVAGVVRALWPAGDAPVLVALRACDSGREAHYELLVDEASMPDSAGGLADRLDAALHANPHYALARRLGQLLPPRIVGTSAAQRREELAAGRARIGDIKPNALVLSR
jgi:hypothetical protein